MMEVVQETAVVGLSPFQSFGEGKDEEEPDHVHDETNFQRNPRIVSHENRA